MTHSFALQCAPRYEVIVHLLALVFLFYPEKEEITKYFWLKQQEFKTFGYGQ